ncbi:MAG: peptidylprolyl isomerase [Candidatus Marinimicrobia bacterium]|nr:peptidylprolyl isomerase [Candidatus Neomarinimicrobiota bacterium]
MKKFQNILVTFISCLWIMGCQQKSEPATNTFARVNDEFLSLDEFVYTYSQKIRFMNNPFDKDMMNYHGGVMIRNTLFAQYMENRADYNIEELEAELEDIKRKAVIDEMIEQILKDSLDMLPEEELRDAYLKSLEYREVRHLFSPDSVKIWIWYQKLLDGTESFYSLSQKAFQDTFLRNHGGYLGFITYGDMVPEFESVVFQIAPGYLSEPFQTPFGWHVLKVESIQKETLPTEDDFQSNKESIRGKILRVKKEKYLSGFYTSLVKEHKIRPDSQGIQTLYRLVVTSKHTGKIIAENVMAFPSDALIQDIERRSINVWDHPVVYVDDKFLTIGEILPYLKNIPLVLLYKNPSQAVLFAVRDELVYQMGLEQGLDSHKTVQMKMNVHRKDWLSNRFINTLTDTITFSYPPYLNEDEQTANTRDMKNTLIHKTYLNLRENADVWTDMEKVYTYYENLIQGRN